MVMAAAVIQGAPTMTWISTSCIAERGTMSSGSWAFSTTSMQWPEETVRGRVTNPAEFTPRLFAHPGGHGLRLRASEEGGMVFVAMLDRAAQAA